MLKSSPLPFLFCWPGETHSGLEVSLSMLGSQNERERKKETDGNHTERFVCNQKEEIYSIAKTVAPLVAVKS